MTRQDLIIATIRTAVPGAIGYLLAQLIAAIPAVADWIVTVDEVLVVSAPGVTVVALVNAAAVALAIAAYYWVARELGRRFPFLEKWLLGRSATPSYVDAGTVGATPSVITTVPAVSLPVESAAYALADKYGKALGLTHEQIYSDYDHLASAPDAPGRHEA